MWARSYMIGCIHLGWMFYITNKHWLYFFTFILCYSIFWFIDAKERLWNNLFFVLIGAQDLNSVSVSQLAGLFLVTLVLQTSMRIEPFGLLEYHFSQAECLRTAQTDSVNALVEEVCCHVLLRNLCFALCFRTWELCSKDKRIGVVIGALWSQLQLFLHFYCWLSQVSRQNSDYWSR